ncbi:MAG: single-stranded DNA-binding protein [Spirochaetes bacterium]|nr:single-stranded DNA-binding protein [Spirochaetota bacterium]
MNTLQAELQTEGLSPVTQTIPRKKAGSYWNWVQLTGRIASDIEKKMVNEQTVLSFTLLFETARKTDREGSHVNFIAVELWGKTAEIFYPLLGKGLEILVTGELFQQRWVGKDGKKAQKYCISAQAIAISDQKFRPN